MTERIVGGVDRVEEIRTRWKNIKTDVRDLTPYDIDTIFAALDSARAELTRMKRLCWTRTPDGTLRADLPGGKAWWEYLSRGQELMLVIGGNGGATHYGEYYNCYGAMQSAEEATHALGLGPEPPNPWTEPEIVDEVEPDPVEEIRKYVNQAEFDDDLFRITPRRVKTIFAALDAARAEIARLKGDEE